MRVNEHFDFGVGFLMLRRGNAVEALDIIRRRGIGELILAGTKIDRRAERRPVRQRQHQVGGGPNRECARIVAETKLE